MQTDPHPPLGASSSAPTLAAPRDALAPDPELLALPAPPRRERTVTVVLMVVTAALAAWMAFTLRGEARYALTQGQPLELGELTALQPTEALANRYVRAGGLLGTAGAIKYGRAAEGDSFRLAPVAGNPKLWVEIRVPEGFEGPRFVPPTQFAGRLVPLAEAGIRHVGLARAVEAQAGVRLAPDAWVLIDGASPRASRWALALVLLFLGFAGWNVAAMGRILVRVRDRERLNGGPST